MKLPNQEVVAKLFTAKGDLTKLWYVDVQEKRDGQTYRARFYAGINQHKNYRVRLQAAKLALSLVQNQIARGWKPSHAKGISAAPTASYQLQQCLTAFADTLRPATLGIYRQAMQRFVSWLEETNRQQLTLHNIGALEVQQYALWLNRQRLSNTSRNTYIVQLGNIWSMAARLGMVTENPFKGVKRLREELKQNLAFTDEQLQLLKRELSDNDTGLWLYVQFIYYCFIRPNELIQLQVKDVNLRTGKVYIPATVAKNRKGQYVNIPLPLLNYLNSIPWKAPGHWYLFSEGFVPGLKPVQRDAATKRHARVLKRLGIGGGCTLYSWKHTGVVKVVQSGANIKDVQNHLRHSSLEMVAKYLRSLGLEASNELASKFPAL